VPKATIVDVCVPGKSSLPENLYEDFTNNLAILIPCQRGPKEAEVWPDRVIAFHQLLEPDMQKKVHYCLWHQDFLHNLLGILNITWIADEA
jgi:hypothetical protein